MSLTYKKVAKVLEAVADYVDDIEATKQAEETAAKTKVVDKLAERYEVSTGESLSTSLRNKLANLDQDVLDHLIKVAHNNSGVPESLGQPTETTDSQPQTIKEAAVKAEDEFVNWILGE